MLVPFSPPPGLNSDDTTFAAEGRWADGNNVRFYNGKPQVIDGIAVRFTNSGLPFPRRILPFNRSGALTVAYAGDDGLGGSPKLYVGSGLSSPSDRTPGGLGTHYSWSLAPWGSTLLACPEGGTLYEQTGTNTAVAITEAPDNITFMLVTPERQVLALGCNEEASGTFNSLCIRGSDIEDYSSAGSWTTSSSNNAFEHILDSGGAIVSGVYVGPYLVVFTTADMYLGTFVGDPGQAFRFEPIERNCGGIAGPNARVAFNGALYWMGQDRRIRRWIPGGRPEILPCPIFNDNHSGIAPTDLRYVVASANSRYNEVRFDYRGGGATSFPTGSLGNGQYVALCLSDGAWYRGAGGATAIGDYGEIAGNSAASGSTILGSRSSGEIVIRDTIDEFFWGGGAAAAQLAPYITSADQYLDKGQRRMMIRSFIPDFEDQSADVFLTLFVRDRPMSSATTKGPHTITTATTKKDFRASGKIVSVKIAGNASQAGLLRCRLGKPLFDMVPLGER